MTKTIEKHLIAIDLDGTLLNDEKTISPLSKKVLKLLENQGHLIVISSGRALRSVKYYAKEVGLKHSPIVCYNGHLVTNLFDENFKSISYILPENTVKKIYRELLDKNLIINAMSESTTDIYNDNDDGFLFAFYDKESMNVNEGPLDENIHEDVYTCVMKYDTTDPTKERDILEVVKKYPDISIRFWFGGDYCELYTNDVSKSKAILDVANFYNIKKENIIVFGDSDNDKEMLCDYNSYLMKNGNPTLKEFSKHITSYINNDDGVARELIKYFDLKI